MKANYLARTLLCGMVMGAGVTAITFGIFLAAWIPSLIGALAFFYGCWVLLGAIEGKGINDTTKSRRK